MRSELHPRRNALTRGIVFAYNFHAVARSDIGGLRDFLRFVFYAKPVKFGYRRGNRLAALFLSEELSMNTVSISRLRHPTERTKPK